MRPTPELAAKPARLIAEPAHAPSATGLVHVFALWISILLPVGILCIVFYDSVSYMADLWINDENYGHGMLVPLVSLYLIWQKRGLLLERSGPGSWWGVVWILAGAALYVIGELATVYQFLHVALWCLIVGLLVSAFGSRAVATIAFPLGFLLTVVPLPQFLYQGLSGRLQLISSAMGVGCLQFIGITAFRDGNVIDLGPIQLQVVDACSGLRYLFPLATLALLCSYLFRERLWKRIVLFVSSIPISILLNGFRIGMIGLLVEHFGQGAAEGFYHLFEGWVLFMASLGLLLAEMVILRKLGPPPGNTGRRQRLAITRHSTVVVFHSTAQAHIPV
jgi:exosortase D (VPLPA-CTERM-specific)